MALAMPLAVQAQNGPLLLKSEIFKDSSKESYIVYAKEDGTGGFYIVRMFKSGIIASPSGYYMEHYDKSLKLIKDFEYAPEFHAYEKYKTLIGVVSGQDQIHLIDIQYNIKEKAYLCLAHSANVTDFKFTTRELFRLDKEAIGKWGKLSLDGLFFSSVSTLNESSNVAFITDDSKSAFAIALNLKTQDKKTLMLYAFDNDLNKKLEHAYVRDVKSKHYIFKNIDIADGGNSAYLMGAVHLEENNSKTFTYEITHITNDGEKTEFVRNEKPYRESLKMLRVDNRLVLAGFYSEENAKWYTGVSYFEIDPVALKTVKIKHTPFSEQLLQGKQRTPWWQPKIFKPLVFKNFIVTEDNGLIINAEEYYITNNNNNTYYNSDDIISASINKDGETLWVSNIDKEKYTQYESDLPFISYTPAYDNKTVHYFINTADEVKNLDDGTIQFRQKGKNRSDLTMVTISENGTMGYKTLLSTNDSDVPFMTANGIILPKAIFFMGRKGSKKQLLRVDLSK